MNKNNCFSALPGLPGHFVFSFLFQPPKPQTSDAFGVSVCLCSAVEDAWGALSRCSMPINNWHQCTRAREAVWYDIRLNLLGRRQSQRRVLGFGLRGERTSLLLQACHKEVQEYLTGKPDGEPAGSSTILIPNARALHSPT